MVFLGFLFFSKNKTLFTNRSSGGLVYNGNEKIGDLVGKDTDEDGVPDWQEGLYGMDPLKKDTNGDGVPDGAEIAKMRGQNIDGEFNLNFDESTLTETDKFSRELFSTIATLNQTGEVTQGTIDTLSNSILEKIQNSPTQKVFLYSDLSVTQGETKKNIKTYNDTINNIYNKYPINYTVFDVLQKFALDINNVDESVLQELSPIVKQTNNVINDLSKITVPQSLAVLHLDFLNKLQTYSENLNKMTLYDTDPVVGISGITQYETLADDLETSRNALTNAIDQKLR